MRAVMPTDATCDGSSQARTGREVLARRKLAEDSGRDRRAVRAEHLTEEDIAAIERSEMGSGYEHLDAEWC